MNMFKGVSATTTKEYMESLPEDRREILEFLHEFIKKEAPQLKPHFAKNMPGYGDFTYTDSKKQEQHWPVVALANQKNYVSLYVCAVDDGEYVAEKYKDELGKVSVGKSCIRFKKLEDINLETLKKVLAFAVKQPGLVYAGEHKKKK